MASKSGDVTTTSGIALLYIKKLEKKSKDQLIQDLIASKIELGKMKEDLASKTKWLKAALEVMEERNRVGGVEKAKKYEPAKKKATQIHGEMKLRLGKNPPLEDFLDELHARYPSEPWPPKKLKSGVTQADLRWNRETVNDWWKAMNAGKSF
jgi:hypothetical protein